MKNVTVSPSNYDENYPFSVGNHRVTWTGTSDSGTQIGCSFHITVNGEVLLLSRVGGYFEENVNYSKLKKCKVYDLITDFDLSVWRQI